MKHIKLFESFFEDYEVPTIEIDEIFYHGTSIVDCEFFNELEYGYSDWEALWFCEEEHIAEEFSEDRAYNNHHNVEVIFKVKLNSNKIASINDHMAQEMMEYYGLEDDFRDMIDILEQKGFEGWKIVGSIDGKVYEDVAIFTTTNRHVIKELSMKFKTDDGWSEYIDISEAEEYFFEHFCKNNDE